MKNSFSEKYLNGIKASLNKREIRYFWLISLTALFLVAFDNFAFFKNITEVEVDAISEYWYKAFNTHPLFYQIDTKLGKVLYE